ncbi:MAG: ABC transporter ATP-binding protein [Spirochaetales bacterium]|nr:ABC transporter ATP-binding protein [Spirochaetales bacterium]
MSVSKIALEARDFVKRYGDFTAVRGVSLSVFRGEIFGLIGPDGAGKTSLIRSWVSLLDIDGGTLHFMERSVTEDADFVRSHVGYMPQRFSLYPDLTVEENLRFFADLFRVSRSEFPERRKELYDFSGLEPFARRKAGALSGGMKQKLALSCMLIHSPEIILLDEPTFGVDPVSRNDFWHILAQLKKRGTTILVSTAYMDEAVLCDRVALMYNGRILTSGAPEALKKSFPEPLYLIRTAHPHLVHDGMEHSELCGECQLFGEGVHLTLRPAVTGQDILSFLSQQGLAYESFEPIPWGMEDLFLRLMTGDSRV